MEVARAIANFERTPVAERRSIYPTLIKFTKLYPAKKRIAIYAPTGIDGAMRFLNFKGTFAEPVCALATRGGSTTVTIGARVEQVDEYHIPYLRRLEGACFYRDFNPRWTKYYNDLIAQQDREQREPAARRK